MQVFLNGLLPRILPPAFRPGVNCFVYAHEGKQDLLRRLPKRLQAYRNYPEEVLLVVIHDQDSASCTALKQQISEIITTTENSPRHLIRIACRELENWYLGDLSAVEKVYPRSKASKLSTKAKYRNPDQLTGSEELKRLAPEFGKTSSARAIAPVISTGENAQVSFRHFVTGLQKLLG